MSKYESVMKKIAALLNMTEANGASPQEALIAAEKASKLMLEYQISRTAAELGSEGILHKELPQHQSGNVKFAREFNIRFQLLQALGDYCSVEVWYDAGRVHENSLNVLGLRSDVELFVYLLDNLSVNAWVNAVAATMHIQPDNRKQRKDFIIGYRAGLFRQVWKIIKSRKEDTEGNKTSDGKSLIIVKQDLLQRKMDEMQMVFKPGRKIKVEINDNFILGVQKGMEASLGRPVESDTEQLKLS